MTSETGQPDQRAFIKPEEATQLDAHYTPILNFDEWSRHSLELGELNRAWERIQTLQAKESQQQLDRAIEVALRTAAVETGAIENLYETPPPGLTFSIAVSAISWETQMRAHDDQLPDFFQAALEAYALAFEIAGSRQPITEVWIRQLHQVLTRPQATYKALTSQGWTEVELPKGVYKRLPNHVLKPNNEPHAYAPVDMTGSEMHRLVEQMATPEFEKASPIIQAAYAHHSLTVIHPFADGNGRVARALASVFLRRQYLIPFLIGTDQRSKYFEALTAADAGRQREFSQFVLDRVIEALTFVATDMGPKPSDYAGRLRGLHEARDGLTHLELDQTALAVRAQLIEAINREIATLRLPSGYVFSVTASGNQMPIPSSDYRHTVQAPASLVLNVSSAAPAGAQVGRMASVMVVIDGGAYFAFRVDTSVQDLIPLDVRLSDVYPSWTPSFDRLARSWAQRVLADALAEVSERAGESLRASGYAG